MEQIYIDQIKKLTEDGYLLDSKLEWLRAIDKVMARNNTELDKQIIHIPFTHKGILDDTGTLTPKVPQLLADNRRIVNDYNTTREECLRLIKKNKRGWRQLGIKMALANDKEANRFSKAIFKTFPLS